MDDSELKFTILRFLNSFIYSPICRNLAAVDLRAGALPSAEFSMRPGLTGLLPVCLGAACRPERRRNVRVPVARPTSPPAAGLRVTDAGGPLADHGRGVRVRGRTGGVI